MPESGKKTVAITTLGCKVNQYESASFASRFTEQGVEVVPFGELADIYVINSCAVTGKAGAQSRQLIRRALRANPGARVVVTGCYAQIATQEVLELADSPICVVGNENKHLLVDIALSRRMCDLEIYLGDISKKKEICDLPVRRFPGRTRCYLKIQDGCNNFCSYCIVPYARGRVRSLVPERVMDQVAVFVREGYRELVLTGIHVGMYGQDFEPKGSLLTLVERLAGEQYGMRYRISSLEPGELSRELLDLMAASSQFMPHFHLPLQSGSSSVLGRMNRKYTVEEFVQVVDMVLAVMPHAAIGLDVLTGFPGEDNIEFEQTLRLIERLPISYLHVFPYSKRPGTPAATMPDQVPAPVKEERAARLTALGKEKRRLFYGRQLDTVHRVLVEGSKNRYKMLKGFTENYIPVYFHGPASLENEIVEVVIEQVKGIDVFGRLA
ncbi:MAG: tRNA (N(6)-L-threonylcarbamoyladenosine(37)-C(2))-methylthiotransferase MtaB [Proteobacteria bacterium]|nr:tRNA (N(6)-L-threonylcarbamoyladenosine(37)-C(2))-methylthiotransferase MtaB [Desulfobulbaceae bacterium]MBU4152312.1 tRNA (N(6)-L-threonylcarbamoyladenosine(37)-C(2))-methylthiotransferase MtaB [Pseudomonadota bacterium]